MIHQKGKSDGQNIESAGWMVDRNWCVRDEYRRSYMEDGGWKMISSICKMVDSR